MKKTVISLGILLLGLCILFGCNKEKTPTATTGAPLFSDFTANDLDGNTVDQTVFSQSKLTMINIWGTFCGPCINEMPELGELNRELPDVQVIGIIIDAVDANLQPLEKEMADAHSIISQTGADYLHLLPSPDLINAYLYNVQAVPETIFVDANGNQVGESYLGARSKAQWLQIIDGLLEGMQ